MKELRAGQFGVALPAQQVGVLDVLDDYYTFKICKPCEERLRYSLAHLIPFWDNKTIAHINVESIQLYCDQTARAPGTLRRELNDLRAAVNHAIKMKRLEQFEFPEIPAKGKAREKALSRAEVAILLKEAKRDYRSRFTLRLYIVIGYYTGARKAAIMGLKWTQIDFVQNTIDFRDPELEETNKRRSFIPMAPKLREFLWRRYNRFADKTEYVFHCKTIPEKRVFSISAGFKSAATRAKLEDTVPHTLRHTRVTEFIQEGRSIRTILEYMALSFQTILGVYAQVNKKDVRDLAEGNGRSRDVRKSK